MAVIRLSQHKIFDVLKMDYASIMIQNFNSSHEGVLNLASIENLS